MCELSAFRPVELLSFTRSHSATHLRQAVITRFVMLIQKYFNNNVNKPKSAILSDIYKYGKIILFEETAAKFAGTE